MSFCRCQYLANSTEDEFIKKKMKTAALLKKMLKRIIAIFFQFQFFLFQQKTYSDVPFNSGSPMIPIHWVW